MNPDWVAAIASLLSASVVAVTAIAAFRQIRLIRNGNDITVYMRLIDRLDSPESRIAFGAIDSFVEKMKTNPELRDRLARAGRVDGFDEIESLLWYLDHLTVLLLKGGISEELILSRYADDIVYLWDRLGEAVYLRRRARGTIRGIALEHLAMRANSFVAAGGMVRLYGRLERDPRLAGFSADK